MNPVEFLLVAASYELLRRNTGRSGVTYAAAAIVYAASYDPAVLVRMARTRAYS